MKLVLVFVVLVSSLAHAVDERVESIVIGDENAGFVNSRVVVELHRSGDDFTDGTRVVLGKEVQRLVAVAMRSPLTKLDVRQLGVTRADVDARVKLWCEILSGPCEASWVDAISKADVAQLVARVFVGEHTDDYPHTSIKLTFASKKTLVLSSESQYQLMVPWVIDDSGTKRETYDVELARVIARALPLPMSTRRRIEGARVVEIAVDKDRDGYAYRPDDPFGLKQPGRRFVDPFGGRIELFDTEVGSQIGFEASGERGWSSRIHGPSPGVLFRVFLPQKANGTFVGASFLRDAESLATRVRHLRWATTRVSPEIDYYDAGFLSPHAYQSALDELRRTDLASAERVKSELWRAVPIHVDKALWLLLPDGSRFCYGGDCSDDAICAEVGRIVRD